MSTLNLYVPRVSAKPTLKPSLLNGGVDTLGALVFCYQDSSYYKWIGGNLWEKELNTRDLKNFALVDTSSELYDTVQIFNYTPSGSTLPPGFGGTAAHTVSGGALNFSGNTRSVFFDSTYIVDSIGTLTEGSIMTATIKYNTVTATDTGISIGWLSVNPFGANQSVMAGFAFNQGGTFGSAVVPFGSAFVSGTSAANGYTGVMVSSSQQTNINSGDVLQYTVVRTGLNYTIIVQNITQSWTLEYTAVTYPLSTPFTANNTAFPAIFWHGGGYSLTNWTYSIIKPHLADLAIEGNSITYGQASTDQNGKWAQQVGIRKNNIISGGGSDVSASVRQRTAEILKGGAKRAAIMIGGNDVLFGVNPAIWQSNLRHIRDTLTQNGMPVIWLYPTPRTGVNINTLVQFLDTCVDFANDKKVRGTFTALIDPANPSLNDLNPIYNSGDGTHPNDLGHWYIASIINDSLVAWGYMNVTVNQHEFNEYILQHGRRSGQAIYGANTDGGSMFIGSTISGKKGVVNIGNDIFDLDGLGFVGMGGNRAPGYQLDVIGTIAATAPNGTPGSPETSARFQASYAYGTNFTRAIINAAPSVGTSSNTGLVITGNPGVQNNALLELSSDYAPMTGEATKSINYYVQMDTGFNLIWTHTTNNSGSPAPNLIFGNALFGPYSMIVDMTNHRLGVGISSNPGFALDVQDHINGITEPFATNSALMASTAYADRASKGISSTLTDFFGATATSLTLINYTFSDALFHTFTVGANIEVNSITSGSPTLTMTVTWENAQTSTIETYSWTPLTTTGPGHYSPIIITGYQTNGIQLAISITGGTMNYNANPVLHEER